MSEATAAPVPLSETPRADSARDVRKKAATCVDRGARPSRRPEAVGTITDHVTSAPTCIIPCQAAANTLNGRATIRLFHVRVWQH